MFVFQIPPGLPLPALLLQDDQPPTTVKHSELCKTAGIPVRLLSSLPLVLRKRLVVIGVVLAAHEIDTKFNVNVLTGSDGVLRGAPGGHPDTAAGSKVCVIVTPLVRGRMATVCEDVVTVTTPGDCVDVLVTDYGIAVNPLRPDLVKCLDDAGIPHVSIESLKEKAYSIVGRPDAVQFEDKVVAVLEARDGTILDVVRQIKPYTFED